MTEVSVEAWLNEQGKGSGITTDQLDAKAKEYQAKYDEYEKQKAIATKLSHEADALEKELIGMLEAAGKQRYHVEGIGLYFFVDKMTVKTPKTNEDKKALFKWLREKRGETFYLSQISINHQTLQALYKSEYEAYLKEQEAKGESGADFHLPGLEAPTNVRGLNLRKEKK